MQAATFKAQDKSNAKRFLVKTSKIAEADLDQYLTQVDGKWGCYVVEGKPVTLASLAQVETPAPAPAPAEAPADEEPHTFDKDDEPAEPLNAPGTDPFARAFGALAMSQLTAPSNTAPPVAAPKVNREGATPTAGLRIQKDRPERNGVRRKSTGTVGDKLFALYDAAGRDVTLAQAKKLAEDAGLSTTSAAIALYSWRKFNSITGGKK